MGGFAALVSGSEIERVDCVVSMAGANLGGLAKRAARSSSETEGMAAHLDGWSGPIKGRSGAELVAEIAENVDRFDTRTHASVLGRKTVLLIAGRWDQVTPVALHHDPLVEALEAERAVSLESEVFENADHAFSGQRIQLTRRVTRWLETNCSPLNGQGGRH